MSNFRKQIINVFGLMIFVAFFAYGGLVGASEKQEVGVTKNKIVVGMTSDFTGPASIIGNGLSQAIKLVFSKVNDEGGIYGRKLELITMDDHFSVPRTVANYQKMVRGKQVMLLAGVCGSINTMALSKLLKEDGVPLIGPVALATVIGDPPKRYIFPILTTWKNQAMVLVDYVMNDLKPKGKVVFGVIGEDGETLRDGAAGIRQQVEKYGILPEEVVVQGYDRYASDLSGPVLKFKRAGVTHGLIVSTAKAAAAILMEMQKIQWDPYVFGLDISAERITLKLAGTAATYGKKYKVAKVKIDELGDVDGAKEYRALIAKYNPDLEPSPSGMHGLAVGKIIVEGLKRAGKNPTREKFVDALETFDNFDTGAVSPLTYGPGRRAGSDGAYILEAKEGSNWNVLTGWRFPK